MAAGAARADQEVIVNQLAASIGEDWRTAHPTCAILLVAGGAPDLAAVRGDAAEDRGAAVAGG